MGLTLICVAGLSSMALSFLKLKREHLLLDMHGVFICFSDEQCAVGVMSVC